LSNGVLKAIPRVPSKTACLAAAKVPECQVELPRLEPRLMHHPPIQWDSIVE
jgi:hypothetical protein